LQGNELWPNKKTHVVPVKSKKGRKLGRKNIGTSTVLIEKSQKNL
jgi:hypothetical protein